MTAFRQRRFQSRHQKPKGTIRYLILLVALFALAIWILTFDVEKAGWLNWMTDVNDSSGMDALVDRQIVSGEMICGFSNRLNHPVWLAFSIDSSHKSPVLQRTYQNQYRIVPVPLRDFQSNTGDATALILHEDQAEMLQELFFNAQNWYEEWGELSMVVGIVDVDLATHPDPIPMDNPADSVFAAIMQRNNQKNATIGFIFPPRHANHSLPIFAKSVDQIEEITGIGLFNDIIADENAGQSESKVGLLSWGYNDSLYLLRTNKSQELDE